MFWKEQKKKKRKYHSTWYSATENLELLPISIALEKHLTSFPPQNGVPTCLCCWWAVALCQPQPWYSLERGDTVGDDALVAADALVLGDADLPAQLVCHHAGVDRRLAQQRRLKGTAGNQCDKLLRPSLPRHHYTGVTAHKIQQKLKRNKRQGREKEQVIFLFK